MAYNLRYYNEVAESARFKRLVRFEILERDYSGSSSQIKMNATISMGQSGDGRGEPIKKKTADISILSTKSLEFEHLFTADDKKYQFKVYRGGNLVFIGFLETDSYSEPYSFYENYMVNFMARDNLGTLKDIPYLDAVGNKFTGLQGIHSILSYVLDKTGYALSTYDYTTQRSSDMTEGISPFNQSNINRDGFWNYADDEPISCYEVLERIMLGFGSQIRQTPQLGWEMREQARYFEMPFINGDDILPRFLQKDLNLNITPNDTFWIGQSANMILQPAWKSFTLNQDYGRSDSIYYPMPSIRDYTDSGELGRLGNKLYTVSDWTTEPITDGGVGFYIGGFLLDENNPQRVIVNDFSYMKTIIPVLEITRDVRFTFKMYIKDNPNLTTHIKIRIGTLILTNNGWETYTTQDGILFTASSPDPDTTIDLTIISNGIPVSGDLSILVNYASSVGSGVGHIAMQDLSIKVISGSSSELIPTKLSLVGTVNTDNNLIPSDTEIKIGQVPNDQDSQSLYINGLFTSAGVAQVDWKRPEDTTTKNLLECVAEGYDLLNNRVSRQISGTVFWDWDFNTNLKDQGRTLMINSGTWDVVNDTLDAEFIEVFEYKTTGEFDDSWNDDYDNNDTGDYKSNSTFTLTQKSE